MGIKENPIVILTRKLWRYSKGNRHKALLYIVLFTVANIIDFLYPLVFAKVLNIIQEQGVTSSSIPSILLYLASFLILEVGFSAFWVPGRIIEQTNAFLASAQYRKHLIDGVLSLPVEWHADHHSGDTIDKIKKGANALFEYGEDTFQLIEAIFRFFGSLAAMAYFNLHSIYIILFITIISITIITKFDKILVRQYGILNKKENSISAKVYDIISNITTVIILRIEKLVSNSMFNKIMSPFKLYKKNRKISEFKWAIVSFVNFTMVVAILAAYIITSVRNSIPVMVGTMSALYGYSQRISSLFFRFAWKYGEMVRQGAAVANAEILEGEFVNSRAFTGGNRLKKKWKRLMIKNLNFSYNLSKKKKHLEDINIEIKRKEKIALIGASGSGKTTFLKIMRGLYHPQYGSLYLDGKRLENGFEDISNNISLIPQDPEIFATTIKENITFGVRYSTEEIKEYTDLAKFTEVIERLPKGIKSSVVEKGVNLSGGEKQRLALARGLIASKDKEVILLDEPTSSIDSKNEYEIYQGIFRKFKNKTIVSALHRLHLLPLFDTIYFFKNGKILAKGSFNDLLKKSYEFQVLWKKYTSKK